MIFHKTCALAGCDIEFDTEMERKLYCCNAHYRQAANSREKEKQRKTRKNGKFKCPDCGLMKSNKHQVFCRACKFRHTRFGIEDTMSQECKLYA